MKDPRDLKKSYFKVRFPTPPPTRIHKLRKHYTKEVKRPTSRELLEIGIVEEEETMPYIAPKRRDIFAKPIEDIIEALEASIVFQPGDLNYVIFSICKEVFTMCPRYQTVCEISGVLSNVKDELYRRLFAPYEDKKIQENGDV